MIGALGFVFQGCLRQSLNNTPFSYSWLSWCIFPSFRCFQFTRHVWTVPEHEDGAIWPNHGKGPVLRQEDENCFAVEYSNNLWYNHSNYRCVLLGSGSCIVRQFRGFDWLRGHGIWAILPCPRNSDIKLSSGSCKAKSTRSSNIRCWIWDDYSQLGARWLSIISYPTCARGITVKCTV